MSKQIERLANKAHIELRSPEFGVSVLEGVSTIPRIALRFETKPFDIGAQSFNGSIAEISIAEAQRLIKLLERGISLADVAVRRAASPDDQRYK